MISQEKLKLMIDLAKYEKNEGHHNEIVNSYFKVDYLSKGLLGSFFAYSLCYFVFFVLVVLYNFEELVSNPNIMDVVARFKPYLRYYVYGLVIYEFITAVVVNIKYNYAKRSQKIETAKLKRLEKRYEIEDKTKQLAREGEA